MSSDRDRLGGIIHTYQKYDPVEFPGPTTEPPDLVTPAFEHMLRFGSTRELTEEELANAIHLDPSQIAGLGPSLEALMEMLRLRVADGSFLRLVGKCLNVGVLDGAQYAEPGVGTAQGELIPLTANPNGGFVKDESGGFVKSRLDEPALKAIAAATGGQYAPLGAQGQGFEAIYSSSLAPLLKHDLASRQQRVYIQRYQWPLAASLALLLTGQLIGTRRRIGVRRRGSVSQSRPAFAGPAAVSLLILTSALAPPGAVHASTASAEEAYQKGDFATAAREYAAAARSSPKKPMLQFNAGTAAYRAGQFPQAAQAFQESISRAPSGDAVRLADQEDAYYNLGNTLYRTGQKTEESSPQQTMQTWTQAVKAYDTALQLRADDADSKFNRDFVKRKIEELKQKQNQPQNQNQPQGQGPQQKPPPNSPQQPNAGTPPPGQQPPGQPPPGQQPPGQPSGQPPGQSPPGQQPPGQPPGQQPPGQQPPGQPPANQPPPSADQSKPGNGQPKPAAGNNDNQPDEGNADRADSERRPGQMTAEEARELLDSQKGEERHALGLPVARREPGAPPDKPVRDW